MYEKEAFENTPSEKIVENPQTQNYEIKVENKQNKIENRKNSEEDKIRSAQLCQAMIRLKQYKKKKSESSNKSYMLRT